MARMVVRFMTLEGKFDVAKVEHFATSAAALVAITSYAASAGYTNVRIVDEGDGDGVRFVATTPGGRGGRNVAFGDWDVDGEVPS